VNIAYQTAKLNISPNHWFILILRNENNDCWNTWVLRMITFTLQVLCIFSSLIPSWIVAFAASSCSVHCVIV